MSPSLGPGIHFENVDVGYGEGAVLRGVSCSIEKGDIVGMVGPNGSGKTTMLRAILGLLAPNRGRVRVRGLSRFAYVAQADETNPHLPLSVREAVSLPLRSRRAFGRLTERERRRIYDAMANVGVLGLAERPLSAVSGGQRQRAILAQALTQDPEVLLLDEPTRGLDMAAERDLLGLVLELRAKEEMTVLLVAHTLHIPLNFCRRILLFREGQVVETSPEDLVGTDMLDRTYGTPFWRVESHGVRWVAPRLEPAKESSQ